MPIYSALNKRLGLSASALNNNPAFYSQYAGSYGLPENYGFPELAMYEEERRRQLGPQFQEQISQLGTKLGTQYDTALKDLQAQNLKRRGELASSLSGTAQKQFAEQTPGMLEELNTRGLLSSPSEVARAQAQAQKELALTSESRLSDYDLQSKAMEDALTQQRLQDLTEISKLSTSTGMQTEQDALDAALDLRRTQLESQLQAAQADREASLARDLGAQAGRQGLTQSLIGAGGSILGGSLPFLFASKGGALGAGAAGTAGTAGTAGAAGTTGAMGLSPFAAALALPAAGYGAMQLADMGKQAGGSLGSLVANPIGAQLNMLKNPGKAVSNIGKSVSKSIKKAFCFDPDTLIDMEDGSNRKISKLYIGAETRGGTVESIRISETQPDTIYSYKGVVVTGSHAVKEGNKWIRIAYSKHAIPLHNESRIVYSLVTDDHRIYANNIEFADEHETDLYEELSIDESLKYLNKQEKVGVS